MRGKNCKIKSTEEVEGGVKITYEWTADDGSTKTTAITVRHGLGIKNAYINDESHIILVMSDDTEIDVGELETSGKLKKEIVATVDVGAVTKGTKFPVGTDYEDILHKVFEKEEPCTIVLTLVPSDTVYDIVTGQITSITLNAVVTEKTFAPQKVTFYEGSMVIKDMEVTKGGTYSFTYTPSAPIKKDVTFKATVTDEKFTNSASKTINFVARSYWGLVGADVTDPQEADIKALVNNGLKLSRGLTYSDITMVNSKICYAYPKSLGELTSIVSKEGYDYMTSYTKTETKVDNIDYYVYTLTTASTIETAGYKQIFA